MQAFQRKQSGTQKQARSGAAAVEFAMVAPLLVILVLGSVDVGQFINVSQVVNDASREGARLASRVEVTSPTEVEAAVQEYFADGFPSIAVTDLNAALTVNVLNSSGVKVSADNPFSNIPSGDSISVQVIFQYETVRSITGFTGINGSSLEKTTVMRRE